jgi:hypothetical protein
MIFTIVKYYKKIYNVIIFMDQIFDVYIDKFYELIFISNVITI